MNEYPDRERKIVLVFQMEFSPFCQTDCNNNVRCLSRFAAMWGLCLWVDELHRQSGQWGGGHPHPEHPALQVSLKVTEAFH